MLSRELAGMALPGSLPACGEQQSPLRALCNQKLPQYLSPVAGLSHCLCSIRMGLAYGVWEEEPVPYIHR